MTDDLNRQDAKGRLPDGWRWVQLGDVCEIIAPQVDPKVPEYAALPHVSGENIESGTCRLTHLKTAAEDAMVSGKYLFEPGDVLYSKLRPYLRKVLVADFRGVCSADMYPIRVRRDALDPRFAAWMLVSDEFTRYADAESRRARMPKLNREQLFAWLAPIPPLPEQQRIAAILNEQMAAVERARAAAEARLKAAKSLPAAYLRAMFGSPETQKWPRRPLGVISEIAGGIQKTPERMPINFHKPYLTVRNVQRGYLDLLQVERFEVTPSELSRLRLLSGDILIVEGNGSLDNIGRNALFVGDGEDWIHQNHIIRVRLSADTACAEFVSRFLNSNQGRSQMIEKAKTTSGLYTLSAGKVASLEVPVPPLIEQQRMAATLNEKMATADRARKTLEGELAAINALPAALLRCAFSGAL